MDLDVGRNAGSTTCPLPGKTRPARAAGENPRLVSRIRCPRSVCTPFAPTVTRGGLNPCPFYIPHSFGPGVTTRQQGTNKQRITHEKQREHELTIALKVLGEQFEKQLAQIEKHSIVDIELQFAKTELERAKAVQAQIEKRIDEIKADLGRLNSVLKLLITEKKKRAASVRKLRDKVKKLTTEANK